MPPASSSGVLGLAPHGRGWDSVCGNSQGVECLLAPHYGLEEYLAFGEGSWYWGWIDTLFLWGGGWSVFLGKGINWDAWSFGGGHLALEEEMLIPGDGC